MNNKDLIKKIEVYLEKYPGLRFGQALYIITHDNDLFNITNEKIGCLIDKKLIDTRYIHITKGNKYEVVKKISDSVSDKNSLSLIEHNSGRRSMTGGLLLPYNDNYISILEKVDVLEQYNLMKFLINEWKDKNQDYENK